MITTKEIEYKDFGKCLHITNGTIELVAGLAFGPRILHFSLLECENMFYLDHEKGMICEGFPEYDGKAQTLYGGHRLWASPEFLPVTYHPDDLPVEVVFGNNEITLVGAVEKHSRLQKSMKITFFGDSSAIRIEHMITNQNLFDVEFAAWALTMFDEGTVEIMPVPDSQTGLLPNRNLVLWPYTKMNDRRIYWGEKFMKLSQNPGISEAFKIGYQNEHGYAACFNKGQVFIKSFESAEGVEYPDFGCSFETYTNGKMLECETLSGLNIIPYGGELTWGEEWELFPCVSIPETEEEMEHFVEKYLSGGGN